MKFESSVDKIKIAVVGLGYVGLPLAVEFGKRFSVIGYDICQARVDELGAGKDSTLECAREELELATGLEFSSDLADIAEANIYIVTVPTPIDKYKQPDLSPLLAASKAIGTLLSKDDFVIYESTVYPGATEEDCVPLLERESKLIFNRDFFVGYSPERINPGDKQHRLVNIKKVTSGSTASAAEFVDHLYRSVITAGTYKASSIRVAEAAKVIENTQRDLNIALVNELAIIFNRMDIDTEEVLKAAGTKWNFLPFRPGLVGGHCIGVDPYYLTHKSQSIGYHPEVILSGRRINDKMGEYVAGELIKGMVRNGVVVNGANVLILGLAFKENCPDIRNTKVIDIVKELATYNVRVAIYDPWVNSDESEKEYGIRLIESLPENFYDSVICAVAHNEFADLNVRGLCKSNHVVYDLKYLFKSDDVDLRL